MNEPVHTWTAIAEIRRLTQQGLSFSIQFEGYSRSKNKRWTGTHRIERCVLRAAPKTNKDQYAEYKLYLFDLDTGENRACWQPLITQFNDQPVQLQ